MLLRITCKLATLPQITHFIVRQIEGKTRIITLAFFFKKKKTLAVKLKSLVRVQKIDYFIAGKFKNIEFENNYLKVWWFWRENSNVKKFGNTKKKISFLARKFKYLEFDFLNSVFELKMNTNLPAGLFSRTDIYYLFLYSTFQGSPQKWN